MTKLLLPPIYLIAEKIIDDEAKIFQVWNENLNDDVFAPFAEKIELIRQQLLEETNTEFSDLEFQVLDKFSRSLVHRLKAAINQVFQSKLNQKKAG